MVIDFCAPGIMHTVHHLSLAHSAFALALGALGCATATGASDPDLGSGAAAGAPGSGSAGLSGAVAGGGSSSGGAGEGRAGAPANSGGATGMSGASSAGGSPSGGASSGGAASGGASSGGTGDTGPVSVGLPYTEDFESGVIAPKLWTAVAGQVPDATFAKWSVVADDTGKAAQLSADGTERFLVGGNSTWTDQKLELRVQVVSGSPEIDIAFRYQALKNYYYLEFADKHFKLRDRSGSNADLVPTGDKPPLAVGTWYKVSLQVKGSALSASLNDVVIVSGSFSTSPIVAGGIAIGVGSGSGVVLFDDIRVTLP